MAIRTTAGLAQADSSQVHWDESLRRIETTSGTQAGGEKTNLETAVEFLLRPRQRDSPLDHWLRPRPARLAPFFTGAKTKQALEQQPHLKPLLKKLLSLGGKAVVLWNGGNGINSVAHLLAEGRLFSNRGLKVVEGEPSQCHDNVFALWQTKPDDYMVVTGYGLSKDGIWRPHSWCVDRKTGKITETTERRTKYFGVETH